MKKLFTKEEVCDKFTLYVRNEFESATQAAAHYDVNKSFITLIKKHVAAPNSQMLADIGFKRKNGFVKG